VALTTIHLVRHAHADWSADDNRPLSAAGMQAAQTLRQVLSPHPLTAVYTSPSRRSVMTIEPLAESLAIAPEVEPDLRERALPMMAVADFEQRIRDYWQFPQRVMDGESNVAAQARGLSVVRRLLTRHAGHHVVVATHGNLLALILNGFDPAIGYEFWQRLSFPDVYCARFENGALANVTREWIRNDS
jgi:2,3-bisphosphoglycerate-dependent phosphoglycerate mutase